MQDLSRYLLVYRLCDLPTLVVTNSEPDPHEEGLSTRPLKARNEASAVSPAAIDTTSNLLLFESENAEVQE